MTTPLLEAFDKQVAWCREPAPFTARVLQASREWLAADEAAHAAFAAVSDKPLAAATALRWAGALHHLALRGLQPWAGLWPPSAAAADNSAVADAVRQAWQEQRAHCVAALALPPQTNEVQRSAALLPGLLHVAAATGLPLRLLEVGSSAGLNLWCDRWRYEHGAWAWGDPAAALCMGSDWVGSPPTQAELRITHRAGCDATPIDLTQPEEGLRLASFIWPDQPERLARLRVAVGEAARWLAQEQVAVEALPAAAFVQRELAKPASGQATVLMHSVVWQYIAPEQQRAIRAAIDAAAQRASTQAPLAWLRFEPPKPDAAMELRCQLWPAGADTLLARCHPHGARIEWLGGAAA